MSNIITIKIDDYTGSIESAQDLVMRLGIEGKHSFDVNSQTLMDHKNGVMYFPGDVYQYCITK